MASPAIPGLFFCFAAFVLLVFVTCSAPIWDAIYFLSAHVDGRTIHFGVFGYTGSGKSVGYDITPSILGFENSGLDTKTIHDLTAVMVLHPVAAALAGISVIFGLCGAGYHRLGTIFMSFSAALATLLTLIVWIIDMTLWGIAKDRIRKHGPAGNNAQYGNANWMVLGALVALLLGFCSALFGSCGRYSRGRTGGAYKV